MSYQYDQASNRARLTWPDGYYANYTYDALNHPTTVIDSGGTTLATYSYDPLARRNKVQYNGVAGAAMNYTWSPESDFNTLSNDFASTANDVTFTNTFSPAHQWLTGGISNSAFRYVPASTATSYSSNVLNQYTLLNGTVGLSHDTRGNYTGGATPTIVYDAENHLMSLSATQTYAYDPNGRRTTKTMAGTTTNFIHDGDSEIAEYDGTGAGTLTRRFVPGVAIDEYVAMVTAAGVKTFFHTDKMGSVIAMSDLSGALVEGPYTYDPYGSCFLGATGCNHLTAANEPFRFTGLRYDIENATYYARARIYSSLLGFYQVDPVGYKDDLNLYVYVHNDPTDLTDPTGKAGQGNISDEAWRKVVQPKQAQALSDVRTVKAALNELKTEMGQLASGQIKALSPAAAAIAKAVQGRFGSNSASTIGKITSMLSKVESVLADTGSHYNYSFSTLSQTTAMLQAGGSSVPPSSILGYSSQGSSTISLTGTFFNNPSDQESTLVHEPTHIFGTGDSGIYGSGMVSFYANKGFDLTNTADAYAVFVVGH